MIWLKISCSAFFAIGLYYLLCQLFRTPTHRADKIIARSGKQKEKRAAESSRLNNAALWLSKHIHPDKIRYAKLKNALDVIGVEKSPELHTADAILKGGLIAVAGIPFLFIMPVFGVAVVIVGLLLGVRQYTSVYDAAKRHRVDLEAELSKFGRSLEQNMSNSRDVVAMLSTYRAVAGEAMRHELSRTIAEMRTGNYEQALIALEGRIGSPGLSSITRGLIGVLRGEDQQIYFKMICSDLHNTEIERLKKIANKRPRAMNKYSMLMLVCLMIIYIVVLAVNIMSSIGTIFT